MISFSASVPVSDPLFGGTLNWLEEQSEVFMDIRKALGSIPNTEKKKKEFFVIVHRVCVVLGMELGDSRGKYPNAKPQPRPIILPRFLMLGAGDGTQGLQHAESCCAAERDFDPCHLHCLR